MAETIPGFPEHFPVRADGRRPRRYRLVSTLCRLVLGALFGPRLRFRGAGNIPSAGPLLVASNHLANWDPLIFGGYFPGTLHAMAKREIYGSRVTAWILAGCNCFPVERNGKDRRALRIALDLMKSKRRLLLFVEGTRSHQPGMRRAEPGAGFLVRRGQARVLPVAISGTEAALRLRPFPRRGWITVRYGEPFMPQGKSDVEIADEIGAAIATMLPDEYRGFYAAAVSGSR